MSPRPWTRGLARATGRRALLLLLAGVIAAVAPVLWIAGATRAPGVTVARLADPLRSEVSIDGRWAATFTDGARSVAVSGPVRTFSEDTTPDQVTGSIWIRLLPRPFDGNVDRAWLASALVDRTPDVLATAMQYVADAPVLLGARRDQIAGDADYGPLRRDGRRSEGSDFNDYLGIPWTYPNGSVERPDPQRRRDIDCSGFIRMVFGFRLGLPLGLEPDGGASMPRQSFRQAAAAPGIVLLPDAGSRLSSLGGLQPGDLLFFDADRGDGSRIDHVGIYLGRDSAGHDRFLSSRKTANGPTLGDLGGRSILDGDGLYATAFREARRV